MLHETTQAGYDCAVVTRLSGPPTLVGGALLLLLISSCVNLSERGSGADGLEGPVENAAASEAREIRESEAALAAALEASPPETTVLRADNRSVAIAYDLDGDRREDVATLSVQTPEGSPFPSGPLFSPPRPPAPESPSYPFLLEVYFRSPRVSAPLRTVALGNHPAARSFFVVPLHAERMLPASVSTEFYTARGTEEVWVVFQNDRNPSLLRLAKHPNAGFEVFDIDGDAVREVVTIQSRLEQGRGYETYLTLYQLTESGYSSAGTINVVRNLRRFLDEVRFEIIAGRWSSIADGAAGSPAELDRFFPPAEDAGPGIEPFVFRRVAENGVEDVRLPQFLENPFGSLQEREPVIIPFNVVCCEGAIFSFLMGVRFRRNPFAGDQFELVPFPRE